MILDKHPNLRFYLIGIILFLFTMFISHLTLYYDAYEFSLFPYRIDNWCFIWLMFPTTWLIPASAITLCWLFKFINFKVAYAIIFAITGIIAVVCGYEVSVGYKFRHYLGELYQPYMHPLAIHEYTGFSSSENDADGRFSVPVNSGFDKLLKQKCELRPPDSWTSYDAFKVDFWYCKSEGLLICPEANGITYGFKYIPYELPELDVPHGE